MKAATALTQKALQAWEANDDNILIACLSENLVCRKFLPQSVDRDQLLDFMHAIMHAFPDWSFQASFLNEHSVRDGIIVHFVTQITGTHSDNLVLPELPVILPTNVKITLPARHLNLFVQDGIIVEIDADFSPDCLTEVLAQLGMKLP